MYDEGLKISVETGSTLLINGKEVSTEKGVYTLDEEGDYELNYAAGGTLNTVNVVIKHQHSFINGICTKCEETDETVGTLIGNLVDGGQYAIGTTLKTEAGSTVKVNGTAITKESDKIDYTFDEAGTYEVEITVNGTTSTGTITIVEDGESSTKVGDLVNGQTYPLGTTIKVSNETLVTVDGIPVEDGYELPSGTHTIMQTDKDGNVTTVIVTIHEHKYEDTVTKEATCTEDGIKSRVCSCGSQFDKTVSALGHEMDGDMTYGYEECIRCGYDEYTVKEVGATTDLVNFDYTNDNKARTVTLTKYKGSSSSVTINGAYEIAGVPYRTIVKSSAIFNENSGYGFFGRQSTVRTVTFTDGVKAVDCSGMFYQCPYLTSVDLSNLNTKQCINMSHMFHHLMGYGTSTDYLQTLDISTLHTGNVTDMSYMFAGDEHNGWESGLIVTELDLSSFNTSNVTDMSMMFGRCKSLKSIDLSSFDTSNVVDMSYMFWVCSALTDLELSSFNTSKVTTMRSMFSSCSALSSLNLCSFDTRNVVTANNMFSYTGALTVIYASDKWVIENADTSSMFFNAGCSQVIILD